MSEPWPVWWFCTLFEMWAEDMGIHKDAMPWESCMDAPEWMPAGGCVQWGWVPNQRMIGREP